MEDREIYEVKSKNSFEIFINSLIEKKGMKVYKIYDLLEISKGTWYIKLRKPEKFYAEEIIKLSNILETDDQLIFGKISKLYAKTIKNETD